MRINPMLAQEYLGLEAQLPDHQMGTADLLVAYLEQIGVEYVFGIPGGAIEPLYNALARSERRGGIRHVLARHESGAAFMADGYARETGKLGVCCSTSGPGATNLITGVACAYDNNVPMLVITGQPALPAFGKHPLQESSCTGIDVLGMFRHCTRYNSLLSHPKQLEQKLAAALQRATRSPRGPVHLSVPFDVFASPSPVLTPSYDLQSLLAPSQAVDEQAIGMLKQMLDEAGKVVLLIGGWCGGAIGTVLEFAAQRGAAIVATPDGKGLINPYHPLYRGVFGFGGHDSAEAVLRDESVDLILAVGASMGEWNSGGWSDSLLNERLVHIDDSDDFLAMTPMARFHVRGNIGATFRRLLKPQPVNRSGDRRLAITSKDAQRWHPDAMVSSLDKAASDAVPIKPQRLMHELGRIFPPETRFFADTGNSVAWATHYLHPADRRAKGSQLGEVRSVPTQRIGADGWLRVVMNFVPMGWAIGAAIGAAISAPRANAPVVCITGDGSMLMNGQEVSVAVAHKLNVVFIVLNDSALGMVRHGQRLAGAEQIGCDIPPTDFTLLARALGANGHVVRSPQELLALDIAAICSHDGPTVLDVRIDAEEVPPMSVRMRVLANKL